MQNKRLEMKKTKGSIMLLFAAFFWGTTFVAQTTASDQIGTFTFNGSRSIVGAAFLALLILARTGMKKQKAKVSGEPVEKESIKRTVIGGILCGCVLFRGISGRRGQLRQIGVSHRNVCGYGCNRIRITREEIT